MKRGKATMAILLAVVLVLSGGLPFMQEEQAQAYTWSGWAGNQPPDKGGFKWGFPEMWWYGKAKVFAYKAELDYRTDDATAFWVKGKAKAGYNRSFFGAYAEWGTPLETGYIYKFTLRMADGMQDFQLPDYITVNGNIVWEEADGYANAAEKEVQFTYVPASNGEIAKIYLIEDLDPQDTTSWYAIYPPHQGEYEDNNFISRRAPYTDPRPNYATYSMPPDTFYKGVNPNQASSYYQTVYGQGVTCCDTTLPELPYAGADVQVVERWLPAIEGNSYYQYADTDIVTYQPKDSEQDFEDWSDAVIAGGSKRIAITPILDRSRTDDGVTATGTYRWFHLSSLLNGSTALFKSVEENDSDGITPTDIMDKLGQAAEDMAGVAHRWLQKVPDGKVYIFEVESSANYGLYKEGIASSNIGNMPGYGDLKNGGIDAWNLAFDFIQHEFYDAVINSTQLTSSDRSKIMTMANFDRAAFQGAYALHAGADIVLHKNIHRQSMNIVAANSRGAAEAYGKQYGYDFDNWDRQYAFSYHPNEIAHGLKLYFHSGADYIMDEINTFDTATGQVTEWGKTWLEFWHYAKTHPKLGDQKVRIGIMHGLGDEWNRVGGPSASWEAAPWLPVGEIDDAFAMSTVPKKWAKAKQAQVQQGGYATEDTYLWDNNLLNLVFSNIGNAYRTNPDRLATGTPHGPVNFIPWDTPEDQLDDYEIVLYFGRGAGITQAEADRLEGYVQGGGTLVMAAGQLRQENGLLITSSFLGVGLGQQKSLNGLPYTKLTAPSAGQVELVLSNGDPAAVSAPYGNGELYMLSGEWLTYWDDLQVGLEADLEGILEEADWLAFSPSYDRLEYGVQSKARSWIFSIFNHGRGYFPSNNGVDDGAWAGTVTLDLGRLGLDGEEVGIYRVEYDRNKTLPYTLVPVTHTIQNGQLSMQLTIDELAEIVVGPEREAQWDFWGTTFSVNDRFDGNELDEWDIMTGATGNTVTAIEASGERFVKMDKTDPTASALSAGRTFQGLSGTVMLEAKVNAPNGADKTRILYVDNTEGDPMMRVSFGYDGNIKAVDGSTTWINTGETYASGTWYRLKIIMKTDTGVYELYVNDAKVGTYDLIPASMVNLGQISFNLQNANADVFYFDDVMARIHLVNDFFDNEAAGAAPPAWTIEQGATGNSAEVYEDVPGSGLKWVRMSKADTTATPFTALRRFSTTAGRAILQTKVNAPDNATKTRLIYIGNSEGEIIAKVSFGYDGKIKVTDGTESVIETGLTYSADTWYKVKLDHQPDTGAFNLYINDAYVGTYDLISGKTEDFAIIQFRLQNAYADVFYFDGVSVEG